MLDLNGSILAANYNPITGMTITHNSFFSKDTGSVIIRQVDYSNSYNMGTIDSNYYFQPYKADHYALRIGASPPYKTFSQWQSLGNDLHTRSSFVQ